MDIYTYLKRLSTNQLENLLVPSPIASQTTRLSPDIAKMIWEILFSRPFEERRLFSMNELERMSTKELSSLLCALLRLETEELRSGTVCKILSILERRDPDKGSTTPDELMPVIQKWKNDMLQKSKIYP